MSRFRFMGDIILTTPVVTALKAHFPDAEIDYLAEPPYIELLRHHPDIAKLIPFERARYGKLPWWKSAVVQLSLIKKLRRSKYDLAIDLLGIPRSAWFLRFTKAPIRVGGCFRYRSHLYTHCFTPEQGWKTAVDFHFLALCKLGIESAPAPPRLFLTEAEKETAQKYLRKKGINLSKKIVGIHPGATWPAKIWPAGRFAELANLIVSRLNADVLITYGPGDRAIVEKMKVKLHSRVILAGLLPLRRLLAVLAALNVYISNDCGPMHLAPAVSTPTIGIFGPGEPDIWFPYSEEDGHRLLIKEINCRPCHQNECHIQHRCMDRISVDEVFQTVATVLENYGS